MHTADPQQYAALHHSTAQAIIAAWQQQLDKLGLSSARSLPQWEQATFALQPDVATGETSLHATWRGTRSELLGSVVIHANGGFFAEYDILVNHPTRQGWFIESVTAWGQNGITKSELKLLPLP